MNPPAPATHTSPGDNARRLLLDRLSGVLSTHSVDIPGYPFGSVVPYCLDAGGLPILLISDLAQHTRNLHADPRAALTVADPVAGDVQQAARLTCVGDVTPLDPGSVDSMARHDRYYPESEAYHRELDFSFFRFDIRRAGYIAGFGGLRWIEAADLIRPNPFPASAERDMVNHMNQDHVPAMEKYCRLIGCPIPEGVTPRMVGVDAEGFHLRVGDRLVRLEFRNPVTRPADVRRELVALVSSSVFPV